MYQDWEKHLMYQDKQKHLLYQDNKETHWINININRIACCTKINIKLLAEWKQTEPLAAPIQTETLTLCEDKKNLFNTSGKIKTTSLTTPSTSATRGVQFSAKIKPPSILRVPLSSPFLILAINTRARCTHFIGMIGVYIKITSSWINRYLFIVSIYITK